MRKTRMLVATCFLLIVTPMLMGARFIVLVVSPNPGGVKGRIQGDGNYGLENTDKFQRVNYSTTNVAAGLVSDGNDLVGGLGWSVLLAPGAGTYNPNVATLYYTRRG